MRRGSAETAPHHRQMTSALKQAIFPVLCGVVKRWVALAVRRATAVVSSAEMNGNDKLHYCGNLNIAHNYAADLRVNPIVGQRPINANYRTLCEHQGDAKIGAAPGVDAVAFDPDPLRGGKIVIQAKRYTDTVSVSAVRDLYGTILNEGANKGILVTTADYGPDAYDFAKGKPITLLNGSEFLYLLQKHGHKARIDLGEARLLMADRGRRASQR